MNRSTNQSGSTLISSLIIILLGVAIVAAAHVATSGQTLLTSRSSDYSALEVTAEGVLDYAYGKWKQQMDQEGLLTTSEATALVSGANLPEVPNGVQITNLKIETLDTHGAPTSSGDPEFTYDYKLSFVYNYAATVTLKSLGIGGERTVTMKRHMMYTAVPPTRGMFFSEGNFELYKPAKMFIGGDVHTNGNAHVSTGSSSSNLTFLSTSKVTYAGSYDNAAPPGAALWSNSGTNYPPYYETGMSAQVKKVAEIKGIGIGTAAEYDTTDSNPNNDGNRELIEPPVPGYDDPPAIAASRIYNNAGLLIEVTGPINPSAPLTQTGNAYTGGNLIIKAQNGTSLSAAQAATVRSAVTNASVTKVQTWIPNLVEVSQQVWIPNMVQVTKEVWVESGYYQTILIWKVWVDTSHWETQTVWEDQGHYETVTTTVDQGHYAMVDQYVQRSIYDKREQQSIPITDLNVGAMNSTLNSLSNFNGIVYIHDTGSGDKNAVRVTNGGVLPNGGLTIATSGGMYVQGDYNTGTTNNPGVVPSNSNPSTNAATTKNGYTTKPAALVADAIMVLSNNWNDGNASKSVNSRNASNTTLNTALIGGYIPSVNGPIGGRSGYSGGMNNFPRFLETWSGDSMTFSGAFVSLYKSKLFTGLWDTGDIYVPPTRYWYFDTLLLERVLPGIPPNGGCVRGQLVKL